MMQQSEHHILALSRHLFLQAYSMIVAIQPEPTVLPPSRIGFGKPCMANGMFSGFSFIIFSESIDFLCSFNFFAANL